MRPSCRTGAAEAPEAPNEGSGTAVARPVLSAEAGSPRGDRRRTGAVVGSAHQADRRHSSCGRGQFAATRPAALVRRHLSGQPVTEATSFYAASVSKQLIAALVADAVLDGPVDPWATVRTFLA